MLDTLYVMDKVAKLHQEELREKRSPRRLPRVRVRNR